MYKTPEELYKKGLEYFESVTADEVTITGLAIYLGFTSRQALLNYEAKDEFVDSVKKLKLKVENFYERALRKHGRSGDIFALKNFGWQDKQEHDVAVTGNISFKMNA